MVRIRATARCGRANRDAHQGRPISALARMADAGDWRTRSGLSFPLRARNARRGVDVIIEAFDSQRGIVRRRVPLLKAIASILTLGFGGSGGREGPTMQMGGAIGSVIGQYLRVTDRERRIVVK